MASLLSSPYHELIPYLPSNWSYSNNTSMVLINVKSYTTEHEEVRRYFRVMPNRIVRHQNINQYGMFLIRQQQLQTIHTHQGIVKVIRFCSVINGKVLNALQYNLDERRLNENIEFAVNTNNLNLTHSNAILVISFLTTESNYLRAVTPERDSDIYIEYVVYF